MKLHEMQARASVAQNKLEKVKRRLLAEDTPMLRARERELQTELDAVKTAYQAYQEKGVKS